MKKKIILITSICLLFIISSLIGIFFTKNVIATSDIDYTFENDYIYNSNDGLDYDTFNIRNQTIISQDNYTATYDFLLENNGILIPNEWINSSTEGYIEIVNEYQSHNKVVELHDVAVGQVAFYQLLDDIEYGTIEYWFLNTDMSNGRPMVWISHGANELFRVYVRDNFVKAYNGAFQECGYVAENVWIHIRIDFECTIGGYNGLSQYKFKVYTNDISYGSFSFINNEIHVDKIEIIGTTAEASYYIDAIGYSWNDYTIGQNIEYPSSITTEIQEIDKCEFAYNLTTFEPNTLNVKNIDNNWLENDDATNVHVKTSGLDDSIIIDYQITQDQDDYGIYKEFNYNNENIFNISFNIKSMDLYNPHLDGWYFNIYTYDDTLLVSLLFNLTTPPDISLYYYDGSDYIFIHELADVVGSFSLNIYINNRVILSLNHKNVVYNWFFSELTNKIGINTIEVIGGHKNDIGDYSNVYIDSIGLYINGSSYLADDLTSLEVSTDIEQWNDNTHNLFKVNGIGNFSFSVYYGGIFQDVIIPYSEFNDIIKRIFYTDDNIFKGNDDYTFIFISNISFIVSEIKVYAIALKESSNFYYLYYYYANINTDKNYFYVLNNKLHFIHTANQNDTLEYMLARFHIENTYAINRSINFKTYFLGISKAFFITNYVSQANSTFILKLGSEVFNYILPQQQIIKSFTILITDDDNDDYYGNSTGYISSIKLIFYPDIELTILTLSLIEIIIPLIVLLIPTLAIASVYGKKAIIPMLILMTVICLIANLIQPEMFFIMMLCLGSALFLQYKRERERGKT